MIGFDFASIRCFVLVVFTRLPSDFSWRFRLYGEDVRQAAVSAFLVLGRGIAILGRGERSCSTWATVVSTWGNWVDGSVVDGLAVDGPAVDAPAIDDPAVDGLAVDGSEVDGPEVDGPAVDGLAVDGPAVDGLAVDGPEVDGPAVDDLATAAGIRASDGSVAPAVERTAHPSWCAGWSSCRVLSGCSSMSRTTGRASYMYSIYLNRVEHTDKITVLQCCPVLYKVELCNKNSS